jgi:hypothetical protein
MDDIYTVPFGTLGKIVHSDFAPNFKEGTEVAILRREPDDKVGDYYQVAYLHAETGEPEIGKLSFFDIRFADQLLERSIIDKLDE